MLELPVVFLDRWVPYAARGALLAEADIGVSAQLPGVDTHFAFCTSLLDYLWARLPVLCTSGDSLGAAFARAGSAALVPPHDLDGWVAALRQLALDPAQRQAMRAAAASCAGEWTWEKIARPLIAFCANPYRIPASAPAADPRVAELEAALAERERYVRHVEGEYQRAVKQLERHTHGAIALGIRRLRDQF